jgi:hypothetical protein
MAPLIFRDWDYFEKHGVIEKIVHALRLYYVDYDIRRQRANIGGFAKRRNLPFPQRQARTLEKELTQHVLFQYLPLATLSRFHVTEPMKISILKQCRQVSFEWVRIWSGKPELRRYMVEQLTRKQKETSEKLAHITELVEYVESCNANRH